jgi:hypothetical protein
MLKQKMGVNVLIFIIMSVTFGLNVAAENRVHSSPHQKPAAIAEKNKKISISSLLSDQWIHKASKRQLQAVHQAFIRFAVTVDQAGTNSKTHASFNNMNWLDLMISSANAQDAGKCSLSDGADCFFGGHLSEWKVVGNKGSCRLPADGKNAACAAGQFFCSNTFFPLSGSASKSEMCVTKQQGYKNLTADCESKYKALSADKKGNLAETIKAVKDKVEPFCNQFDDVKCPYDACVTLKDKIKDLTATPAAGTKPETTTDSTDVKPDAPVTTAPVAGPSILDQLKQEGVYSCKNDDTDARKSLTKIVNVDGGMNDLLKSLDQKSDVVKKEKKSTVIHKEITDLGCPSKIRYQILRFGRKGIKYQYQQSDSSTDYSEQQVTLEKNEDLRPTFKQKDNDRLVCKEAWQAHDIRLKAEVRNSEIQEGLTYLAGEKPKTITHIQLKEKITGIDGFDETCFYSDKLTAKQMFDIIKLKTNPTSVIQAPLTAGASAAGTEAK